MKHPSSAFENVDLKMNDDHGALGAFKTRYQLSLDLL
ncbi:hypothetical protein MCP1_370033 [Candidatus Terasakiella magnetica]|nr:hypothetical protein MCP1_370033 [Candidatus Terasakiella magnetica]